MAPKQDGGNTPLALVLDGSRTDDAEAKVARETIVSELGKAGFSCVEHILRDEEVAPCIGCFNCWLKTPGICIYKDDGKQISMDMARCRLIVLVTPVTFGGYSSELKKGAGPSTCPYSYLILPTMMARPIIRTAIPRGSMSSPSAR